MAEYSRATSRGDWTGEWDPSAVTQVLLRMDSFIGSGDPRPTPDSSGKNRDAYVVNYAGSDAVAVATPWGTGIRMNEAGASQETSVRVENDGTLFPTSGSVMVGTWFRGKLDRQWNPVLSTRNTPGAHPLLHLNVNTSANGPQLNYRFYDTAGNQVVNEWLTPVLEADKWYWIGAVMDITLGTWSVYVVSYETGAVLSASGTASLNAACTAHLDVAFGPAGEWSRSIADEVVVVAPFTGNAGQLAQRARLADGAVDATQADTGTVIGRISPRPTASLPVVAHTRAMPGQWGTDTPMITLNGQGATVRYRTSNNLTTWGAWKNASQIETEPNAAWIQYEVTLAAADSYLDDILLSTAPPPTPPLPSTRPVEPFSLDPLLVVPSGGGVLLQDTLLSCKTFDTSSNESTLEFSVSLADPKATLMESEAPILFKGRHYVARGVTTRRSKNEAIVEVYAERNWYDLLYAGQIDPQTWTGSAFDVMSSILAGTDWYVGQVDPTAVLGWENDSTTVLGMLKQIAKVYGGDLVFDDKTRFVHLLNQGGRDRGTYFDYINGISSAVRREDTTNLVTRLYGRNADGLTIAPANGGVDYIEDFTWTDQVRVSTYDFKSGMTPQAMMRFLTAFLADRAKPTLSYEYQVSGLVDRVEEVDRFEVLDIVFVMDEDYGQSVKNRVVQLDIDWVDLRKSKITLANKLRSLASSDDSSDPGALTTGQTIDTRDINPFNLLVNSRGDNGMAHWAGQNVSVVEGGATGRYSFAFGAAGGSLEQTVTSDNRDSFVFSAQVDADTDAALQIEVTFQYTDGTSETQTLEL
ncbi:minor tail protein [Microbacterium phage Lucky3]|uniref:Minor tail protein n=2 Tax=Kojivirus golden TaxID=2560590 RepID=A0A2P1CFQ6_9CAUD|nr:minor tail protein [Microbacterium phage Golden]AVJ49766.1 minor tail protein [Microbacterium phage Golden]AVJ50076.1 minor tail protein [Microbacterium phage Lucky3]